MHLPRTLSTEDGAHWEAQMDPFWTTYAPIYAHKEVHVRTKKDLF